MTRTMSGSGLSRRALIMLAILAFGFFLPLAYGQYGITVGTDKSQYTPGSIVTVSGTITPAGAGIDVGIEVRSPSSLAVWIDAVKTQAGGTFSSQFQLAADAAYGTYTVHASVSGSHGQSTFNVGAPAPPPPPAPPTSAVTIAVSKSLVEVGESVVISGAVSLAGVITVTIQVSSGSGPWTTLAQVPSSASGAYSYQWTPPGVEVVYSLRSTIPASGVYPSATSGVVAVTTTLLPGGAVNKTCNVTLPSGGTCTLQARSNSSSVSLSLNSSERKISVNVTGPPGTTGVLVLFIPNELLQGVGSTVEEMVFMIDGIEVTPTITAVAGGYLITLTYTHSTHTLDVYYDTHDLTVRVLDADGNPAPASVVVNLTGPVKRTGLTDASGVVVFTKLPTGSYTIEAFEVDEVGRVVLVISSPGQYSVQTTLGKIESDYEQLQASYQQLEASNQQLQANYTQLTQAMQQLQANYEDLQAANQRLQGDYDGLRTWFIGYGALSVVAAVVLVVLLMRARKAK